MSRIEGPGGAVDGFNGGAVIVAAADSGTRSRVPLDAAYVQVAAVATDANDWIVLPSGALPGHIVRGYSAVGHEIRTEANSNVKINNIDADGSAEAAITGTWNWEAQYHGATGWVLKAWTNLAAPTTAIVPD